MRDKLRKRYHVHKEVAQGGRFEGEIELSELERLGELLYAGDTGAEHRKVTVDFEFTRSEFDSPLLVGHLQTALTLECQRCLQPMELPLSLDFSLLVDASEDMVRQGGRDTLYSDEGYIDIAEVVEDEIILALPLVAMHDDTDCNSNWQVAAAAAEPAERENPFAVLQQLKTTE
jgi:uncharacterized protein